MRPLARIVRIALQRVRPTARAIGCVAELEEVTRLLTDGTGADRQRAAHARGGIDSVQRDLAARTRPAQALVA